MTTVSSFKIVGVLIHILLFFNMGHAQVESSSELYRNIMGLDSILFVNGFNNCELKEMEHLIAPDLEFYHDQSGISTSKEDFFKAIKQNICGKGDKKPIRKLVANSMEVYPLYNNGVLYGAIQNGIHEFYIKEANKELYITGIAKFSHVFILQEGMWQLKRVLSYDHRSPKE
ncbi:DUF4440 domain-containing protein [Arenibacter troitsensis]|uniref:Uncharacterized protein n=1 Tax=Arenibacter troitsensis TaxID=188872 RepID=A0A1X7JE37_9FLAO|nr:DUF4440 domain-containing protein [Arenibacter troitsensis]SMG25914.1 protein of unknown function [Arenibacter troitsensis]